MLVDVARQKAVVVGGGSVSLRKVETLLHYGAEVVVVAPRIAPEIEALARDGKVTVHFRPYEASDLTDAALAIAATDDADVNARIAADARAARVPVNVVDVPATSTFILPAVIEEGSIQVAVSTGGNSPALARRIKSDLRAALAGYAELSEILGALRPVAKATLATDADRKRFFEAVIATDALTLFREGRADAARAAVAAVCNTFGLDPSAALGERRNGS